MRCSMTAFLGGVPLDVCRTHPCHIQSCGRKASLCAAASNPQAQLETGVVDSRDAKKPSIDVAAPIFEAANDTRLPVTVLSGFLGAGKTSLLMHILRNKAGLRCAVLVNDMAELNVDAGLLRDGDVVQVEEELVEMQNGCICCTLRVDLIVEVAKLARAGRFDYLVIESTGISEPMQVAETFTMDIPLDIDLESDSDAEPDEADALPDAQPLEALANLARLDTCVTVIDAANFDQTMSSVITVQEGEYSRTRRGGDGGETDGNVVEVSDEDNRTLVNLMVDQIEFADVIIINKVDIALPSQVNYIKALVKTLNPSAELLTSVNCHVPLNKVVGTRLFDMEKATEMPAWQRDVAEMQAGIEPTPETEEYGVGSFVFDALRPFHPERLHQFVEDYFLLVSVEYGDRDEEESDEGEVADDTRAENPAYDFHHADAKDRDVQSSDDVDANDTYEEEEDLMMDIEERQRLQVEMKERSIADFGGIVLRSKGTAWVASSDGCSCVWSGAGTFLALYQQSPWESEVEGADIIDDKERQMPRVETSSNTPHGCRDEKYAMHGLDSDFVLGEKGTSLVMIGHQIDKERLRKKLEDCLLTDEEISDLGAPVQDSGGWSDLEDPFEFPVQSGGPIVETIDSSEGQVEF